MVYASSISAYDITSILLNLLSISLLTNLRISTDTKRTKFFFAFLNSLKACAKVSITSSETSISIFKKEPPEVCLIPFLIASSIYPESITTLISPETAILLQIYLESDARTCSTNVMTSFSLGAQSAKDSIISFKLRTEIFSPSNLCNTSEILCIVTCRKTSFNRSGYRFSN
ncbi:Uncharacterised protein [Shigella sonnei]|nr:Uncharacterised protein [Shigella sonnei]CSJ08899.1 Uncharacterised protein [Shigella sonnei]CSP95254.1 Uncharacterised protein [Shigella sonnei]